MRGHGFSSKKLRVSVFGARGGVKVIAVIAYFGCGGLKTSKILSFGAYDTTTTGRVTTLNPKP